MCQVGYRTHDSANSPGILHRLVKYSFHLNIQELPTFHA